MRVIGVLDLRDGKAVHARAGQRANYAPVRNVAGRAIEAGDALALARWYVDLGVGELYVADLDAIERRSPQRALIENLAGLGVPLWLDAGVSSVAAARDALQLGARQVVVGLETLTTFEALDEICAGIGGSHVAFSLDLRDGRPLAGDGLIEGTDPAVRLAQRAAAAGVGAIIVLDLALIGRIRGAAPGVALLAGGGVRDGADLSGLSDAGCDGALVATALMSGRLKLWGSGERGTRPHHL
jgi:phosphoribosylformimino-5-aminoimidazole carboxamide ribotide isomerase